MSAISCWADRFRAAVLVVVLIVVAPWCVTGFLQVEKMAYAMRQPVEPESGVVNNALTREFVDLSSYSAVRIDESAGVCGFESQASPEQTLSGSALEVEEKAWTCVPSGDGVSASFYKGEGEYRWAYVSCGRVQGVTVAVCNLA